MKGKPNSGGRTIFIGDVHGCLEELKDMNRVLAPTKEDRIIVLGDLINRGPDSAGVVSYVLDKGWECLMGNHEYEYLDNQTSERMRKLRNDIGSRAHRWIESMPLFIETHDFLAVHAGLQPGLHPSDTDPSLLVNIRTWDGHGADLKNPMNPAWYEFYTDPKPVFYGHWAFAGLTLRHNTLGLDSGCVYGKSLTAYI